MKKTTLTMAQALVRFLDSQFVSLDGVEYKFIEGIFAIFGHGNVTGLGEALVVQKHSLNFVQGHNEQGMAHAAMAFAKQRRRLATYAVTTSIGPGAMNLVTAAGTATSNRIPVLFLPGDVFVSRQPDPVLQQIEQSYDYTITANDALRPVSKYWDRISRPEQIMTAGLNAMRVLTDPAETGAVVLSLPQDTQGESYDFPEEFFEKRVHRIDRVVPSDEAVKELYTRISQAKRPFLICGGGVRYSHAEEAFGSFAKDFDIPFGETQAGKGSLNWDHPQNLGGVGVTGTEAANKVAKEADLVVAVGTRMGDFTTASKWLFQNPDCRFASINVNRFDTYKMNASACVGDARVTLEKLRSVRNGHKSSYRGSYRAKKESWNHEVERMFSATSSEDLSQTQVLGMLNETLLSPHSVIVAAAGSLPGDLQRLWRPHETDTYHLEYAFSCMGYEIAGAMGAKMADPQREVYALVGDGSYLMLHSELLTCVRSGVKIIVVLFDNHGFQCIDNLQTGHGIPSFGNQWWQDEEKGEYVSVDYAAAARAYGLGSKTARTAEELKKAVEAAKRSSRAFLVDVKIAPKSMSGGYESWWRVGTPEVSTQGAVADAHRRMQENLRKAKKF